MFREYSNIALVSTMLDEVFFHNSYGEYKYVSPYTVTTRWYDDETIEISAKGFYKTIKAKDNIIDNLLGTSWEERVRNAQQKAFETAYLTVRKEEEKKYIIGKFQ